MAHFPCYALSSSLEMMHGLKLTQQKTKSNIRSFPSLSITFAHTKKHPVVLVAPDNHLLWQAELTMTVDFPPVRIQTHAENFKGISYHKTVVPQCHCFILDLFWQGVHMPISFSCFYNVKCREIWICTGSEGFRACISTKITMEQKIFSMSHRCWCILHNKPRLSSKS